MFSLFIVLIAVDVLFGYWPDCQRTLVLAVYLGAISTVVEAFRQARQRR
jgi:hypothetical protein